MKGNPAMPGGSLTSKPAWSNTPWRGVRRRRPFFGFGVIIGRLRKRADRWRNGIAQLQL